MREAVVGEWVKHNGHMAAIQWVRYWEDEPSEEFVETMVVYVREALSHGATVTD